MISMDECWNEDRNDSSREPDPVSQFYLDICVVRNGSARTEVSVRTPEVCDGQTCGASEVTPAASNAVTV